ncbi:hypothetical protein P8452_17428 [Trifolium repens]|nr:hypothetical protein P8452_17428 [Trifolium repens]
MASTIVSLISILLFCITVAQGRKALYTINEFSASSPVINDGICKNIVEIQGYTCEEHKVTTEDGYILSLHRIPTTQYNKKGTRLPVLIQHDLFCAYWDWSWDELASYDLPASVQYVYNYTRQKIHYVGHSQGTLIAFAALSQGKLLNMLRSTALLSPIAHMNLIPSELTKAFADLFLANDVYWLGLREFIPNVDVETKFVQGICNTLNLNCADLILPLLTGPNCCINSSRIDFYLDHEPQPTATKNLIHFSQMIRTGQIAKYDYNDEIQNMLHYGYGQRVPPIYDITKIPSEFPLFLGYGGKDYLSDVQDVINDHDADKLVVLFTDDYAHADYIAGFNAKQVVSFMIP